MIALIPAPVILVVKLPVIRISVVRVLQPDAIRVVPGPIDVEAARKFGIVFEQHVAIPVRDSHTPVATVVSGLFNRHSQDVFSAR